MTTYVGARQAAGSILRYFVIAVGFVIILQTAGIDLTALNVPQGIEMPFPQRELRIRGGSVEVTSREP